MASQAQPEAQQLANAGLDDLGAMVLPQISINFFAGARCNVVFNVLKAAPADSDDDDDDESLDDGDEKDQ